MSSVGLMTRCLGESGKALVFPSGIVAELFLLSEEEGLVTCKIDSPGSTSMVAHGASELVMAAAPAVVVTCTIGVKNSWCATLGLAGVEAFL